MAFSTAFQPSLGYLLQIWPWRPFSASSSGAREPLQNCLFDASLAEFGPFAADLALVSIFSLLARCPRTPSRMAFSTGFRSSLDHLLQIWSWCKFSAWCPRSPSKTAFSTEFRSSLGNLLQIYLALVAIFSLLTRCPKAPPE